MLATLGRLEEATQSFANAVGVAKLNGYTFLEAVALRDWQEAVSADPDAAFRVARLFEEAMCVMLFLVTSLASSKAKCDGYWVAVTRFSRECTTVQF